jgi:hypothetical protein
MAPRWTALVYRTMLPVPSEKVTLRLRFRKTCVTSVELITLCDIFIGTSNLSDWKNQTTDSGLSGSKRRAYRIT